MEKIIKYGIVGVANNVAGYLIYLFLTHIGMQPKTAMSIVYVCGVIFSFVGNRNWTFADQGRLSTSAVRYILVYALGYVLNYSTLHIFVDIYAYPHYIVQAVAIVYIAGILFLCNKFFVFRDSE